MVTKENVPSDVFFFFLWNTSSKHINASYLWRRAAVAQEVERIAYWARGWWFDLDGQASTLRGSSLPSVCKCVCASGWMSSKNLVKRFGHDCDINAVEVTVDIVSF